MSTEGGSSRALPFDLFTTLVLSRCYAIATDPSRTIISSASGTALSRLNVAIAFRARAVDDGNNKIFHQRSMGTSDDITSAVTTCDETKNLCPASDNVGNPCWPSGDVMQGKQTATIRGSCCVRF
jgi:hypothetical protein